MAKKATKLKPLAVQYVSYRKVPDVLKAGGRVCLYDSHQGLPDLVSPPESLEKVLRWFVVHFPSRRWVAVATKIKGIAALKEIHNGKDNLGLLPVIEKTKKAKSSKPKDHSSSAGAAARASQEPDNNPPDSSSEEDSKKVQLPPDANFDQAMQIVFPVSRITGEIEKLLSASTPVYARDGTKLGNTPAHAVRMSALKTLMEYHQGRPGEKEKPPVEKPRMSYDELVAWIMDNEAAQEYMGKILEKAKRQRELKKSTGAAPPPAP